MSIQEILESAGLPAQRGVYTGRDKPDAYYTFLRLLGTPAVNADDEEKERREMYRVTLFHKGDFEAQLDKTKEVLKAAGVYYQQHRRRKLRNRNGVLVSAYHSRDFERGVIKQ